MKSLNNQNGLTLIEVIAGVVLISIVLIAFFSFFTNASIFNAKNNNNIQASNIAREFTADVAEQYEGKSLTELINNHNFVKTTDSENGLDIYKKTATKNEYYIETIIYDERASTNSYRVLRPVKVSVWKGQKEGIPTSESFTYHEGEVLQP